MAVRWPAKCSVRIPLDVRAGACGDEVVGWVRGVLKLRVTALPERGLANAAVERLLAEILGAERHQVRIVRGLTSRQKIVEIEDFDEEDIERYLPGRESPS